MLITETCVHGMVSGWAYSQYLARRWCYNSSEWFGEDFLVVSFLALNSAELIARY